MSLREKLASGEFVVLAEMEPPKGVDVSAMVAHATRVKNRVDAFVVPEMSNAVMRMSSLGGCMVLAGKGLETVLQMCCRDRNRLALQADLLAAHALGIANIMAVTGDDPSFGDHHRTRGVYDIDLLELLEGIQKMEDGRDMAGIELKGAPSFCVGSTVNAGASGGMLDLELQQLDKKIAVGAEFFITPPIFDLQTLARFTKRLGDRLAARAAERARTPRDDGGPACAFRIRRAAVVAGRRGVASGDGRCGGRIGGECRNGRHGIDSTGAPSAGSRARVLSA